MPQALIDSVRDLLSSLIHYELGSAHFYVVVAAFVVTWVIVARVLMGLLKSDRGFIAALFALALPIFFGLLAYGIVDWQVVPRVEADWAERFLASGVLVLVVVLIILLLSSRVFLLSGFFAVFIFVFASAAAVGAYLAADITLKTLEKGGEQIKQREDRINKEIDSVL